MLFSSPPLRSVSFDLDPHDLFDSQYKLLTAPAQKKARWKAILITSFIWSFALSYIIGDDKFGRLEKITAAFAVIFLLSTLISFFQTRKKTIQQTIEKNMEKSYPGGHGAGGLLGPRTFSIYENGVSMLTESDFEQKSWASLSAIILLQDSIFVFYTPATYQALPKVQLGDDEFQRVTDLLSQTAPQNLIRTKFDYPL